MGARFLCEPVQLAQLVARAVMDQHDLVDLTTAKGIFAAYLY